MKRQAFVHPHEPSADAFDPVENTEDMPVKPRGGLWTSTLREDATGRPACAWLEWCRAEHYGPHPDAHVWALDVPDDVRVFTVDGLADLATLLDEFARDDVDDRLAESFAAPDYEALRGAGYDGVRLTDRGQRETRFSRPGLYGWDVESTLWLTWPDPEAVEDLGPV